MAKKNERVLRLEMALHQLTNQVIACCQALTEAMGRPGCEELAQDVFERLQSYAATATATLEGCVDAVGPALKTPPPQALPGKRRGRPKKLPVMDGQPNSLPEKEPANAS